MQVEIDNTQCGQSSFTEIWY